MIIFCEECGAKNVVAQGKSKSGMTCSFCDNLLRFDLGQENIRPKRPLRHSRLRVTFGSQAFELRAEKRVVTLGRVPGNDISVVDSPASRYHARLELRDDEFLLIDHSKNGTYVFIEGERPTSLRQNELALSGKGVIGLGRKLDADSDKAIHFTLS